MTVAGSLSLALGLGVVPSRAAWHAVRRVLLADGDPPARSRDLLTLLAHALAVDPSSAEVEPGKAFVKVEERRALVDALVIAACIEGEVSRERERVTLAIAKDLGVRSHWADLLPALRTRNTFAVKRALVVRSPDARRLFSRIWKEEGVLGIFRALGFVMGVHRDRELPQRYRALAALPEGAFGRAVADHFAARSIAFPGEKNGMPERMIHHDLMHVVNGYDTDAAGECELAAFYAAFAPGDAFTFFVIALATFHLGLAVSPSAVTPSRGAFVPERALAAFLRGRRLRVDVMGAWDHWELMALSMTEVQTRLGLDLRE